MRSQRATRYLERLERRPHIDDLGVVRRALEEAGVTATDALLAFHDEFAGYVKPAPDEFVYGLVHAAPRWIGALAVETFTDDDMPYVICADGHPSYELCLDLQGVHYTTCRVPRATSFGMMIEQDAFVTAACDGHAVMGASLGLNNDRRELSEVLLPRLAAHLVAEVSDEHGRIYATDELVLEHLVHFDSYQVWVLDGKRPVELRDLRWDRNTRRSWAELRDDLLSPYDGRRYQAIYDLRESTDPEAGPLFHLAMADTNERTQMAALDGLRRLRWRDALGDVLALIDRTGEMGVVNFAIGAATEIGGRAAQAAIVRATRHPDQYVRRNAVLALAEVGDAQVVPALEALLEDAAIPMAGPAGDQRRIADEARNAIAAIRARAR
jgi:HEAT repeats